MGDTLVDPPIQPTLPDGPIDEVAALRRRRAKIAVAGAIVLAAALAVAVGLVYFFLIRFVPTAGRHVPANASVVIRIELQQIATYAPVRKQIWPLLFEPASGGGSKHGKPLAQKIAEHTGIDVKTDVREVLVASVDAAAWIAVLGGRLRRGKFVSGMEQVAREEGWLGYRREGDVLVGPGVVLAQAEDGTVLVGTDRALVRAALPASDDVAHLSPPPEGAVAFALTKQAWTGASRVLATLPHGWTLDHVEGMTGRFVLGDHPNVEGRMNPGKGLDASALAGELQTVLGELRLFTVLAPDLAGEKEALVAAKVHVDGAVVVVDAPWPESGIERGCERLAQLLK